MGRTPIAGRVSAGQRFGCWTVLEQVKLDPPGPGGLRHAWLCRCDCGNERVVTTANLVHGRSLSCGCQRAEKSAARLDPERGNVLGLRDGTMVSAIRPDRKPNKNNGSGIKGVSWNKKTQKWVAAICVKGKQIYLGSYDLIKDAAAARKAAEEEYFKPLIDEYNVSKGNDNNDNKEDNHASQR